MASLELAPGPARISLTASGTSVCGTNRQETVPIPALLQWAGDALGGQIVDWFRISGGNRYQSFIISAKQPDAAEVTRFYLRYQMPRPATVEPYTVLREIAFYRLLEGSGVPAARLIAVNENFPAVILEHIEGIAEYRRLSDEVERRTIALEFTAALAGLHAIAVDPALLPPADVRQTMRECALREVADWKAMYLEVPTREPLIDLALHWLETNIPDVQELAILVHGDAGPGNFLFKDGHLTALIDWEFAHLGDPHDDLAWFAMRCVMEPVPDFVECLRQYERLSGRSVDLARLRFYQVLVSTRVLIIRHRNVSGEYGNSIVSQALNRRLLTTALALANGISLPAPDVGQVPPTSLTSMYDHLINSLRDDIVAESSNKKIVSAGKNLAKISKFLREVDRYGPDLEKRERDALREILGHDPDTREAGHHAVAQAAITGQLPFEDALPFFDACAHYGAILAATASGSISKRTWPSVR